MYKSVILQISNNLHHSRKREHSLMKLLNPTLRILLAACLLIPALQSAAQNKALVAEIFNQAEEAFYQGNYRKSLDLFNRLDSMNTEDDAYYRYRVGVCYLYSNLDKGGQAINYIEGSVSELQNSDVADYVWFHLGRAYHVAHRFDEATEAYAKVRDMEYTDEGLKAEAVRQIDMCSNGKQLVNSPEDVLIRNVGSVVNTPYPDYKPVISADESSLVFTSCNTSSTGGKKDKSGQYYEDIYITYRDNYGNWDSPRKISSNINTDFDEASVGLSVDGRQLIIYRGRKNGGELYTSVLEGDNWSEPAKFDENINSKGWETSASLSPDGKTMYFTSDRKGGFGGLDIYKSEKQNDGTWGPAENLGPNINTAYDEESPFIHPDNKTLYFSSAGRNSMGGLDVFKSVNEGGIWAAPINMGYPINSGRHDVHFVLTANGKRGYYTSSKTGGQGEEDIYLIDFQGSTVPLILVRGNVVKKGGPPGQVDIQVISREDNTVQKLIYQPDPITGKYLMILPPGKAYDMVVEAEDFKPYLLSIDIPEQKEFREFYQKIELEAIPPQGERMYERISIVNAFDDYRGLDDDYKELVDAANKSNRDYLKILTERITEANNSSDSAAIIAENLAKIFTATDPLAEEVANLESEDIEEVAAALVDEGQKGTTEVEARYVYDEENPEKDLAPFIVDGDTLKVVPPGYMADLGEPVEPVDPGTGEPTGEPTGTGTGTGTGLREALAMDWPDVLFGYDRSDLSSKFRKEVDDVVVLMKKYPNLKVTVEGHTDSKGSDSYNLALSRRRAEAVRAYMTRQGIADSRIVTKGYGEARPKAPNENPDGSDNPEGRALNRRTELDLKK